VRAVPRPARPHGPDLSRPSAVGERRTGHDLPGQTGRLPSGCGEGADEAAGPSPHGVPWPGQAAVLRRHAQRGQGNLSGACQRLGRSGRGPACDRLACGRGCAGGRAAVRQAEDAPREGAARARCAARLGTGLARGRTRHVARPRARHRARNPRRKRTHRSVLRRACGTRAYGRAARVTRRTHTRATTRNRGRGSRT
jgi:hypothetical protein